MLTFKVEKIVSGRVKRGTRVATVCHNLLNKQCMAGGLLVRLGYLNTTQERRARKLFG